jgi:hypothetical protein
LRNWVENLKGKYNTALEDVLVEPIRACVELRKI